MSFGFIVDGPSSDRWSQDATGAVIRELLAVTLFEISCVGMGAYPKSFFDARNAPAAIRAKLKRDSGDARELDPDYGQDDTDTDDTDTDFELCSACRSMVEQCSQCSRSKRAAVDSTGLPVRSGVCLRHVRQLCQRCFDAYSSAVNEDDTDARSRRRLAVQLLLRAANS